MLSKSIKVFNIVFKDRYFYRFSNILFQSFLFILFLLFTTVFFNLGLLMQTASSKLTFYGFIKQTATQEQINNLKNTVANWPEINSIRVISKEEGMIILKKSLGKESSIIDSIETNPLPVTLEINVKPDFSDPSSVNLLQNKIQNYDLFDWLDSTQKQLAPLLAIKKYLNTLFIALSIALIIIILITLKMSTKSLLYRYRKQLTLLKSLGATQSFIAMPFVVEGVVETLSSSVIASISTYLISDTFKQQLSQINIPMAHLPEPIFLLFIASVSLIGALSGLTFSKIK